MSKSILKNEAEKKTNGRSLTVIIVAAVLLVAIILSLVFLVIVPAVKKDKNFDYMKSDLSKYIKLSEEDYKNVSLSLSIARPKAIDVDIAILGMRAMDKSAEPLNDGKYMTDVAVGAGDIVNVYYRGYVIEDGKEKTVLMNLSKSIAQVEIGGGEFPAWGFELGLLGMVPEEHTSFSKIENGTVSDGQVIYLTYERYEKGSTTKAASGESIRIDLTDDDVDATYGAGFKAAVLGRTIGATLTFNTTIDGKTYEYKNTTVDFVTECEHDENIIKVEGYFPYNSGVSSLNNKTVYFDVFLNSLQDYDAPDFTDDYVTEKVAEVDSGLRMDELMEYEGETLTAKYMDYVEKYLEEQYEIKRKELIIDQLWTEYTRAVEVKRTPGIKVDAIYDEYYNQVKSEFEASGGIIYNSMTEDSEDYSDDLAGYAKVYLGLWYSEEDWTDVVRDLAEDLVVERIILYYIMKEENLTPDETALAAKVAEVKQEYMDEYIYQYLLDYDENRAEFEDSNIDKNKEYAAKMNKIIAAWKANDLENADYAAFYAEREAEMFSYYDEEYFIETAYYEIVVDEMVKWPEVTTMDGAAVK